MRQVVSFVGIVGLMVLVGVAWAGDGGPDPVNDHGPLGPIGDGCAHPFTISTLPYVYTGTTCGWRDDLQDYSTCNPVLADAPDVVFRYLPPEAQRVNVEVCNAAYDVRLVVLDYLLMPVACSDHSCVNEVGQLTGARLEGVSLDPHHDYYIVVDGAGSGCGAFTLNFLLYDESLPVELTGFDAVPGDRRVTLSWSTASETDNDRFELFRDNRLIARVAGNGNSSSEHHYGWLDLDLVNGVEYTYTLDAIDVQGGREHVAVQSATPTAPVEALDYALDQNYPNPFNPTTKIAFHLPEAGDVLLKVFNPVGREVATVVNRPLAEGRHEVVFDAANLSTGMYIYRLEVGHTFITQKKMLLIK